MKIPHISLSNFHKEKIKWIFSNKMKYVARIKSAMYLTVIYLSEHRKRYCSLTPTTMLVLPWMARKIRPWVYHHRKQGEFGYRLRRARQLSRKGHNVKIPQISLDHEEWGVSLRVPQTRHWSWLESCLISCRMPTNLFIKANWKQNWEKQLVVSQKMYLHEVYFKGSPISRYDVICDVGWIWHLKMSEAVRFICSPYWVEMSPLLQADLVLISNFKIWKGLTLICFTPVLPVSSHFLT